MLAFRTLLALLAVSLVSVAAAPPSHHKRALSLHHNRSPSLHLSRAPSRKNRRRTCRPPQSTDVPSSEPVTLPANPNADPAKKPDSDPTKKPDSVLATDKPNHPVTATDSPKEAETETSTHTSTNTKPTGKPTSTSSQVKSTPTNKDDHDASDSDSDDDSDSESGDETVLTGLLAKLFPVGSISQSWTTSAEVKGHLPLADSTFRISGDMKELSHDTVNAPDGKSSLEAIYPAGSWNPSAPKKGGFSFYAAGPADVDVQKAREIMVSYSVLFSKDFDFVKGGKLPGPYGGAPGEGKGCSGGSRKDLCFSSRFMWRTEGVGELYTYLPPSEKVNDSVCKQISDSDCNDIYGASVGRGHIKFIRGQRAILGQRVLLNTLGQKNGEIEVFFNGKSIFEVKGLVLRTDSSVVFDGIMAQTFFGGSDSSWAPHTTQKAYFGDFSLAITKWL